MYQLQCQCGHTTGAHHTFLWIIKSRAVHGGPYCPRCGQQTENEGVVSNSEQDNEKWSKWIEQFKGD